MSGTSRKISELTTATALVGTEVLPIVQDGETRQVAIAEVSAFSPVRSVNGLSGVVELAISNIIGVEGIVQNGEVSALIGAVSARVDTVETSAAAVSVRVDDVSAAITSVQSYLLSQISVATSGVFTEAPNDGQVYGRQSLAWVPVSITALQSQVDAVSALVSNVAANGVSAFPYDFCFAASDESTVLTTGTAIEFTFPRNMTISDIVLEVNTAPASTTSTFVVRTSLSSFHSGQIQIDPTERTSRTAAVTTSIVKVSTTQWERGYVDVSVADAAIAGLKVYILGTVPA